MSLIDVKALKERIENWSEADAYYHPYSPYSKSYTIPIPELYDILTRMPTVDAVPVEWAKKWFTRHIDEMFENYELERDDPNGFNADTIRALANPKISVVHCAVCRLRGTVCCPLTITTENALYDNTADDDFCSYGERRDEDEAD